MMLKKKFMLVATVIGFCGSVLASTVVHSVMPQGAAYTNCQKVVNGKVYDTNINKDNITETDKDIVIPVYFRFRECINGFPYTIIINEDKISLSYRNIHSDPLEQFIKGFLLFPVIIEEIVDPILSGKKLEVVEIIDDTIVVIEATFSKKNIKRAIDKSEDGQVRYNVTMAFSEGSGTATLMFEEDAEDMIFVRLL